MTQYDVLDLGLSSSAATIVADLTRADSIDADSFDCFILVQTLHFIYDVHSAVAEVHRTLKPGGVVLCTVPSVSRVSRRSLESEYWRTRATLFSSGHCSSRAEGLKLTAYPARVLNQVTTARPRSSVR